MKRPIVEVKPGQTWTDLGKRMNGRTVRVERIDSVSCTSVIRGEACNRVRLYAVCRDAGGRYTRLSVERMSTQRFWRLVRDENGKRVDVEQP